MKVRDMKWSKDMDIWWPEMKSKTAIHIMGMEHTSDDIGYIVRFVNTDTDEAFTLHEPTIRDAHKTFSEMRKWAIKQGFRFG